MCMTTVGNYTRLSLTELEPLIANPNKLDDFLCENANSERSLYINIFWHLIHFLLTGDAWNGDEVLRNLVLGGEKLSENEVGFGESVRYLLPNQVKATYEAVKNVTSNQLWSRFDRKVVTDAYIYPIGYWSESSEESAKECVLDYFEKLKEFFKITVEHEQAMLIWFS